MYSEDPSLSLHSLPFSLFHSPSYFPLEEEPCLHLCVLSPEVFTGQSPVQHCCWAALL